MRLILLIAIGAIAVVLLTGCTYNNCPGPACAYPDYPYQCGLYRCADLSQGYWAVDPGPYPLAPRY